MTRPDPIDLLRSMLRIRLVEEALADRYAEQEMRCPMHLCIGQEAIAVGMCAALRPHDGVFSNHRAHGHFLAKGGNLNAMVAELYGRSGGCCGGRGGSMHLIDLAAGFIGSTPIVGGTVPLAVGAAWAAALKGENKVYVVFFGDGCFEEGVIHESMNFAVLHRLPVIFVCENNGFSVYTRLNQRQPQRPIYRVAAAHGLAAYICDGNDIEATVNIAIEVVDAARRGGGPQFLELNTYRWREHCGPNFDNELSYRSPSEIDIGLAGCPIARFTEKLLLTNPTIDAEVAQFKAEICIEIDAAFEFALSSPKPSIDSATERVYA